MKQLQSRLAPPHLTEQLLPVTEAAPDDTVHGVLSFVLCIKRDRLQKITWIQWILMAIAVFAFIYFLVHWLILTSAARLYPEQEWLNGTAVFATAVLILIVLRGSMSAAVELLAAKKQMSAALNQANEVQARTAVQLDTLQAHLDSAEERAKAQAEARQREAHDFEHKLNLVTDLRCKMGDDLNGWLDQLTNKTRELNQHTQMLARITWMQAKGILIQSGQLDVETGLIKTEGLRTLQTITGPSNDISPLLQESADGGGAKHLSEERGLQLFEAKVASELEYSSSSAPPTLGRYSSP
mmetsp:Transcript_33864/g.55938  ORF Transcript_33864/g.55938 Transcript_33864/m.55938 type:complete len:297 (-) Transcript_33864:334-1224(-)